MMLTKAIIEKQEHIGFACQTGQAQARAKSRYALDEVSVGNLRAKSYEVWRQQMSRDGKGYLGGPK